MGGHRAHGIRSDERQRREGQADLDRGVFREREGAGEPASDVFRAGSGQDRGHGPGRAGLGGVSEGIRHQGTQEVTDLSRAVSSAKPPETCVIRFL